MTTLSERWGPFLLRFSKGIFGLWNLLFVCATLSLWPALPDLVMDGWAGNVPWDYLSIFLIWMVLPWVCVGWAHPYRQQPTWFIPFLFFAVEGPLYLLSLYRLVILRELTPAVMQWLWLLLFGWLILAVDQVWGDRLRARAAAGWQVLQLMGAAALLMVALYLGSLLLLSSAPMALNALWQLLLPTNWWTVIKGTMENPVLPPFLLIGLALVTITVICVLAMPVCMTLMARYAMGAAWQQPALRPVWRGAVVAAMVLIQGGVFVVVNHQPQNEVMAQLKAGGLSPEAFAAQQSQLREGLLNAYLAPYRYASSEKESRGIAGDYEKLLGWSESWAAAPQVVFNLIAKPLLYSGGVMQDDGQRAAELYEHYFDRPIQRGERVAIVKALSATHDRDQREAGLVNIDQRKVWVADQSVQVQVLPVGDMARITLDETYVNLTNEPQEIFYLFSLPESAAITGLWLGNSPNTMLPHTLATRGAAQRVYRAEVNKRIDPALLEQVGPRQYRLRAFPVPARPWRVSDPRQQPERLYLRLQYTAFAESGAWPLPVLAEKRNVFFDQRTPRRCDGQPCVAKGESWWPQDRPLAKTAVPAAHRFRLNPSGVTVQALPVQNNDTPTLPRKKITLVVDRSWSMAVHRAALLAALQEARSLMAGHEVSVLLTTTAARGQAPKWLPLSEVNDQTLGGFIGGGRVDDWLSQVLAQPDAVADLTLVLTDSGAFDLDKNKPRPTWPGGMLSFVHVGGALAPVYDDKTLEAVQASGGSSFTQLSDAWRHYAESQASGPGYLMRHGVYRYSVVDGADGTNAPANDEAFAPVAARLFIAQAARARQPLDVAQLDTLHALASQHSVVTPYSSMLVLVNAAQQEALAQAQAKDDRFDRAHEQGTELLQKPNNPLKATATPEPEEWLLILVSVAALIWMWRSRRPRFRGAGAA